MMRVRLCVLVCCLVAGLSAAVSSAEEGLTVSEPFSDHVTILNRDVFDSLVINQDKTWLVILCNTGSNDECEQLKSIASEVGETLDGIVGVGWADLAANQNLPQAYGVVSVPAVLLFPALPQSNPYKANEYYKKPKLYSGDSSGFTKFAVSDLEDLVERLTADSIDDFKAGSGSKAVLFSKKTAPTPLVKSLAIHFRNRLTLGIVSASDAELAAAFGVTKYPTLIALPAGGGDPVVYDGPAGPHPIREFLEDFAHTETTPEEQLGLPPKKTAAVSLTPQMFDEMVLKDDRTWLVEFYRDTDIMYTMQARGVFEATAAKLLDKVHFGTLDCDAFPATCKGYKLTAFPSILLFRHDAKKTPVAYNGERSVKDIALYAVQFMRDHVTQLGAHNYDAFMQYNPTGTYKVILFTSKQIKSPMYKALARDFYPALKFAQVHESEALLVRQYGVQKLPTLYVVGPSPQHNGEVIQMMYTGNLRYHDIKEFLNQFAHLTGLLEQIAQNNGATEAVAERATVPYVGTNEAFESECKGKMGVCIIAVFAHDELPNGRDTPSQTAQRRFDILERAAGAFVELPASLMWLTSAHDDFIDSFGVDYFPAVLALNPRKGRYDVLRGSFSVSAIREFVDGLLQGNQRTTALKGTLPRLVDDIPPFEPLSDDVDIDAFKPNPDDYEESDDGSDEEDNADFLAAAMAAAARGRGKTEL